MKMFYRNLKLVWKASPFYLLGMFLTSISSAGTNIVSIFAFASLIDAGANLSNNMDINIQNIFFPFSLIIFCAVANIFFDQMQLYLSEVRRQRVIDYIDTLIISKLSELPASVVETPEFQDEFKIIEVFSKDKFINTVEVRLPTLFKSLAVLIYAGIAIVINNPMILILILVTNFLFVMWVIKENAKFYSLVEKWTPIRRQKDYLVSLSHDLGMFTNLKVYSLFKYLLGKISSLQVELFTRNNNYRKKFRVLAIIISLISYFTANLSARAYYAWLLVSGALSIGQFSFFFQIVDTINVNSFYTFGPIMDIKDNNYYVKHLFRFLDLPVTKEDGNIKLEDNDLYIEFKNVSFSYPGRKTPALKNISFKLPSGDKLAILGQNGSGKSTLMKLLAKYYIPSSGKILINGINLNRIDTLWWRNQISYLVQEVPRYYLSVKENIEIGDYKSKLDIESIDNSIRLAELYDDVNDLPKREETMLGKFFEGGVDLSGGQWQKLSIARSLYGSSKILVLDEPTSAIDTISEQNIMRNILDKAKTQSLLIVSHKLSNIIFANQIILLEKGKITEKGTHSQLLELNGKYSEIFKLQSQIYE